ncbi:hypothetical protein D3C71_1699410 [compost metagenome]
MSSCRSGQAPKHLCTSLSTAGTGVRAKRKTIALWQPPFLPPAALPRSSNMTSCQVRVSTCWSIRCDGAFPGSSNMPAISAQTPDASP